MLRFERIEGVLNRLATYSPVEVLIELALIWIGVYLIVRFVRGTGATGALKGLLIIIVVTTILAWVLRQDDSFQRIGWLYDRFLTLATLGLLVIFQPELRRALVRLGETPFFRQSAGELAGVVDALVEACAYFSRAKFGAIIVLQRGIPVRGIPGVEGGTTLNSRVSAELLQTIFFPGAALHDLAVIIHGSTIQSAKVQLPLAEPAEMPDPRLGSRHRAAVGLSNKCDALVIVVSEETGRIRLAERGKLSDPLTPEQLRAELVRRLKQTPHTPAGHAHDPHPHEPVPPGDEGRVHGFSEEAPPQPIALTSRDAKESAA